MLKNKSFAFRKKKIEEKTWKFGIIAANIIMTFVFNL